MPITELKCLEILIRYLSKNTDLKKEIYSEFEEISTFENTKTNLFNMISIDNLLNNYNNNPSFSLEAFLKTGIIPGMYDEKTFVPSLDIRYLNNYKEFYKNLIEAFQEENYLFDDSNNIFVSSLKLETTIPQVWLYRLSQAFKRTKYERMYFFNKNQENNIVDKNSLLDYIRHTKTFLVELSSYDPNANYEKEFNNAKTRIGKKLKNKRTVKVEEIIELFESSISDTFNTNISKYKLSDAFWLISKAEKVGRDFYSEPLNVQQQYINQWMLEYINSNERANKEAQKYILVTSVNDLPNTEDISVDKKSALIGLFNLYIKTIKKFDLDYNCISMTDFKIKNYMSENLQENLALLSPIIKKINKINSDKIELGKRINDLVPTIADINDADEVAFKKAEYNLLLEEFNKQELLEEKYQEHRREIQEIIRVEQKNSIESIAFDNEKILSLIVKSVESGRVYIEPGSSSITIEAYNEQLGKTNFKATINIDKLLTFIENLNYSLEEASYSLR